MYNAANSDIISQVCRTNSWPAFVRVNRQTYQIDCPAPNEYVQIDLVSNTRRQVRCAGLVHRPPISPIGYIPPPVVIGLVSPASPASLNKSTPTPSAPSLSRLPINPPGLSLTYTTYRNNHYYLDILISHQCRI
jgi:hypothetical protein